MKQAVLSVPQPQKQTSTEEGDVYPSAVRQLKAELLRMLPGARQTAQYVCTADSAIDIQLTYSCEAFPHGGTVAIGTQPGSPISNALRCPSVSGATGCTDPSNHSAAPESQMPMPIPAED